jgi:hypothetical protein
VENEDGRSHLALSQQNGHGVSQLFDGRQKDKDRFARDETTGLPFEVLSVRAESEVPDQEVAQGEPYQATDRDGKGE